MPLPTVPTATPRVQAAGGEGPQFDEILRERLVRPVYQPILDLDRDVVVGYESLARGPLGGLHTPAALFTAARAAGRVGALDWLCREQAVAGARAGGMRHPLSLFVNAEPAALLEEHEDDEERWSSFADIRCYAELTERDLAASPATLLRAVEHVRANDWGVAIDDIGTDPASLALLPLIQPDVIKLDLSLTQHVPADVADLGAAPVLHAALALAADSGATLVMEGIETPAQLDLARGLGIHYGQGFLIGRPAPLPAALSTPPAPIPLLPRLNDRSVVPGPFAIVVNHATTRRVVPGAVDEIARQLLAQALHLSPAPVVLVAAGDPSLLTAPLHALLDELADRDLPLFGVLTGPAGRDLGTSAAFAPHPIERIDPIKEDFDIVVINDHYAAALVGRRALPVQADGALDTALTFDRHAVQRAASALAGRL